MSHSGLGKRLALREGERRAPGEIAVRRGDERDAGVADEAREQVRERGDGQLAVGREGRAF